ncbi:DUF2586 family protein [Salmonella enterica]|nr:DUF2586 family protein [Salmonella enterica]
MHLNNRARELLDGYSAGMAQQFGARDASRYFSLNNPQENALRLALLESVEFLDMLTCLDVDQLSGQVISVGSSVLHTGRSESGRFIRQVGVDGTVADSPARVKTGALLNLGSDELPEDGTGKTLELATLKALEAQRYSVPMWYPDYDGFYWADGRTLDVEGGDYQSIETLRIVDKAARRVRLLAIGKIADRSLNSTPGSIAAHQTLFARPLREMSTAANINGVSFPGEVKPPQDGDVSIVWKSKKAVDIYIVVRTYEVPLQITISLLLDASLEAAA